MYSTPPIPMDGPSGSRETHDLVTSNTLHVDCVSSCDKRPVTLDALPDNVLLHIFHFDRVIHLNNGCEYFDPFLPWRWDRLVHVCRSWRSIIFASPKFLDLKLVCRPWSRMELMEAGIWPPLPIDIADVFRETSPDHYVFDAVTVHRNRVREIHLFGLTSLHVQRLASAMQDQFPALIRLRLESDSGYVIPAPTLPLPDGFLGGSAPRLQPLEFCSIPFPALPKLLLSATDLVRLTLRDIPCSGYFSPEEIVTGLAGLANLKSLSLKTSFLRSSHREVRNAPPSTRTVLPALIYFSFGGFIEYLEDLVARIDAPFLDSIHTGLDNRPISKFPQLARFMRRSTKFYPPNDVHMHYEYNGIQVKSLPPRRGFDEGFKLKILYKMGWDLSHLVYVFASFLPSTYLVDHLYIYYSNQCTWRPDMGYTEFFRTLTGVKNLYVAKELAECIALALKELVGVADVLPALEYVFFEELQPSGPVQEALAPFVDARRLLGHPVAVSSWDKTGDHFAFQSLVEFCMKYPY